MRDRLEAPRPEAEQPADLLGAAEFRETVSHAVAMALRSLMVVLPILFLFTLTSPETHTLVALAALFLLTVILDLLRRQLRPTAILHILVTALLIYGVFDAAVYGSIRSAGVVSFIGAVVVGGLFVRLSTLVVLVVVTAACLIGLTTAQHAGLLPIPDYNVGPLQLSVYICAVCALAANVYFVRKLALNALLRARAALAERDQVEAALRESEERFSKIFTSSPVSLTVVDLETRQLIDYNEACVRTFRANPEDFPLGTAIGTRFWSDPREFEAIMARLLREGRITGAIVQMVRADGEAFEARLSMELIELDRRRLLINVVEDVSEERAAREALKRSENEATFALERLTFAADAARVYSWSWERDTDQLTFSTPPDELLGPRPPGVPYPPFIDMVHPDDRAEHAAISAKVLESLSDYEREFRIVRTDGQVRWLMSRGRAYGDSTGRAVYMAGIAVDISARKEAEADRRALEVQLRESQKLEAIGTLAGGIAHDFNNILGAIIGNLALARKDIPPNSRALVSLDEINKASLRAKSLVGQILTFSRRQPHELTEQELRPIIDEAVGLLRVSLPAAIELTVRFDETSLFVRADATQIGQVLVNLCTNAWHAMLGRAGHIDIEVASTALDAEQAQRFGAVAAGDYVCICVTDDGHGMDEATLKRIFEPFYTTKPVGQGTGLGLAVVHGIVTAHQGAISISSTPGHGTTAEVYLPLVTNPARVPPAEAPALETIDGKARHIVYIDDDEAMVFLVTRMLQDVGFRVSGFERGDVALDALRVQSGQPENRADLIVTDYNMPGCSGLDVAREMARIDPALPVVMTSGYVTEELHAQARSAGVRHVVYKPNTLSELCETIQRLLAELERK